jgi:hypothetical protein
MKWRGPDMMKINANSRRPKKTMIPAEEEEDTDVLCDGDRTAEAMEDILSP